MTPTQLDVLANLVSLIANAIHNDNPLPLFKEAKLLRQQAQALREEERRAAENLEEHY